MEKINNNLIVQPYEKPKNPLVWLMLSFQHVFAMFGATILVPILIGLDPAMAIFCSGLGTMIYLLCTKGKVPIYIGSSFAFITASTIALQSGGHGAVAAGLVCVAAVYIVISFILRATGSNWLNKLIPPIVIGPMIMVIGLGLAGTAVSSAGLTAATFDLKFAGVACFTLLVTALISIVGKGFFKIIPILSGIASGYILSLTLGLVDTSIFKDMTLFSMPNFQIPGVTYSFEWGYALMFAPIALVTIAEHIGEHSIISNICKKDFLKEPGIKWTLLGDGLATLAAGLIGGPANTTYGENNGVIAMTKVASVYVIGLAALIAMILAFLNPVSLFIQSIPSPVMGGISIMLFGIIASNGVKVMIENKIDFGKSRNLIIAATMLILGIGGATIDLSEYFKLDPGALTFSGMSIAAIIGMALNLVLPHEKEYQESLVEKDI